MSEEWALAFGAIMNTLLTNTNCKSAYFAKHYIYKDASLVSKWLHGTQFPTPDMFPLIVRFAMEQSNAATRSIMRIEIDRHVSSAGLDDSTIQTISDIPDFDSYLLSVFNALVNLKNADRTPAIRTDGFSGMANPSANPDAPDDPLYRTAPVSRAQHRLTVSPADFAYAALAALSGEIIWKMAAAALRLAPVTGALGGVDGVWNAAWGVTLALSSMGLALLSLGGQSVFVRGLPVGRRLTFLGCYGAAGGIAGLLLGCAGLFGISPRSFPPLALVFVCSLLLSFLPLLCVCALLKHLRFEARTFLLLEFGPCLVCTFVAAPFMLQAASLQAGDIFTGFVLGLVMYSSVRVVLQLYPGRIQLRLFGPDAR